MYCWFDTPITFLLPTSNDICWWWILMINTYFILGAKSTLCTEGRETSKFPPSINNIFPLPTPTTTSASTPLTPGLLPSQSMVANAALYGLHPAASLIPSLYMQNLFLQYQKLISEYPSTISTGNVNHEDEQYITV